MWSFAILTVTTLTGVVYKEMYSPRKKVAIITRWPCYWGSHKAGFHCKKEGWRLYKLLKIHSCNYFHPFLWQSEKTANIWPGHNWFPGKMTSGKWGQKFQWWPFTTQIWVLGLIGLKFASTNQKALPRSGYWHVISMEFLHSFYRHHLAMKPVI